LMLHFVPCIVEPNTMPQLPITRSSILTALRAALEPLPYVHAIWEGGAAAFGRVDEWSDCDFHPSSFFLHP
ncbi:MAG: Nucleotidyltransferase protein, partial [Anaerolineales bacterium]|nr:Nucleotidyltransferase protein [Anaerolineales bacterium]